MNPPFASKFVLILIAVLCLSLMAQYTIELPDSVGNIPITGQSLAVLLISYFLGLRDGCIALLIYLMLGAVGLPVFADGGSGIGAFTGPSGGFLYGFFLTCLFSNILLDYSASDIKSLFQFMVLCTALILLFGGLHLRMFLNWQEVWEHGIEPFLPGAMIKLVIATLVAYGVRHYIMETDQQHAMTSTPLGGKSMTEEE